MITIIVSLHPFYVVHYLQTILFLQVDDIHFRFDSYFLKENQRH